MSGNLIKPCGNNGILCQNLTTPSLPTFFPSFLFCYTCNENWSACKAPLDRVLTAGNLLRCNGQCVRFQNPNDGLSKFIINMFFSILKKTLIYRKISQIIETYRGCSVDYGFTTRQPPTILFNNVIYNFCDTNG